MKKIIFLLALVLSGIETKAQMSRWIMQPQYDSIYIAPGAPLLISDSLETSFIWSFEGKLLSQTQDCINPFKEGLSVTTKKGSDEVTGFYDSKGAFTELKDCTLAYDDTFFKDGYLLVKAKDKYCFINSEGKEEDFGSYVKMYPFNNGFATCFTYEQPEKQKNPYFAYITADKSNITFRYADDVFDKNDVTFLSSINDEGVGVAIINEKVYLFDKETCGLTPVFSNKAETKRKRQVVVENEPIVFLSNKKDEDSLTIRAKSKKEYVDFLFDSQLRLYRIEKTDTVITYQEDIVKEKEYTSPFTPVEKDGQYALNYNGEEVLPSQFDGVGVCLNDFAVVRKGNKWGMLEYNKSLKYSFKINDNKSIGFRHQYYIADVELKIPSELSEDKCDFRFDENSGCVINEKNRTPTINKNGVWVTYTDCQLLFPDSLTLDKKVVNYPVQITYDGLKYPITQIEAMAWHVKAYDVELKEKEVVNGVATILVDITYTELGNETDSYFSVKVKSDSIAQDSTSLQDSTALNIKMIDDINRYKYRYELNNLAEGVNKIRVVITEDGCPPYEFPFDITYIKPKKKSRNKPEVKEEIKVEKKEMELGKKVMFDKSLNFELD